MKLLIEKSHQQKVKPYIFQNERTKLENGRIKLTFKLKDPDNEISMNFRKH